MNFYRGILIGLIGVMATPVATFANGQSRYENAVRAYYQQDYDKTLRLLRRVNGASVPEKFVLQAQVYRKQGRFQNANSSLSQYRPNSPDIEGYIRYSMIENALSSRSPKTAERLINEGQNTRSWSFLRKKSQLELAHYYFKRRMMVETSNILGSLAKSDIDDVFYPQLLMLRIRVALYQRNQPEVVRYYTDLIRHFPDADADRKLWRQIRKVFHNASHPTDGFQTFEDHFTYMLSLIKRKLYKSAEREGVFIVKNWPKHKQIASVRLRLAEVYYRQDRYIKVIEATKAFFRHKADSQDIARAYFLVGSAYSRLGEPKTALRSYIRLLTDFPDSQFERDAYYEITKYYYSYGPFSKFQSAYQAFQSQYGSSPQFAKLYWEIEWEKLQKTAARGFEGEAISDLDRLVQDRTLSSRLKRFYNWFIGNRELPKHLRFRGVPYSADNVRKGILRVPTSYFARTHLTKLSTPQNPSDPLLTEWNTIYGVLYNLGYADLAQQELGYRLKIHKLQKKPALYSRMRLLNRLGQFSEAAKSFQENTRYDEKRFATTSRLFLQQMYPKAHWGSVKKYADKYKIDPYLVLAIMKVSSNFESGYRTGAEKQGIMKVDGKVAKGLAFRLGRHWKSDRVLGNVDENIMYGTYLIGRLLDLFNDDLHYALAAYQSGVTNTRRWIHSIYNEDSMAFVKYLPYNKPREFILRVQETYIIYSLLYK